MATSKKQVVDSAYCTSVEELSEPIRAKVIGDIPTWVSGTLLRNGPGKFEVGDTAYRHVYDGLALLQQFVVEDGKVTYFNRFLRSQTYQTNMKAGKIVEGELGTPSVPDPCKNIFSRWFTYFFPKDYTDNASVNICCIQSKIYALTEVPIVTEIDPSSLETLNRVKLSDAFKGGKLKQLFHASAHPQKDEEGNVYNLNVGYGEKIGLVYVITMLPEKRDAVHDGAGSVKSAMNDGKVIGTIPASRRQAYSHSFGMSEKHIIFIQQPLVVNLWKLAASPFLGCSILDTFSWDPSKSTIFHVMSRETGDVIATFSATAFFFFHVVNAYDIDDEIVIDICSYPNSDIFYTFYLKESRKGSNQENNNEQLTSQLRRYRLPVRKTEGLQAQPIILQSSESGQDFEILFDGGIDLPRINEKYNRKQYRFVYGCSSQSSSTIDGLVLDKLVKVDMEEKKSLFWSREDCLASEPVFIASPDSQDEDHGVVLSAVYDKRNENSFLLVLDAQTFTEIARAEVPLRFAPTFHGYFLPKQ